ncbi:MAG: nucleotide sugar dehydrogenase [Alphaproteobacteria bacterium]|nr:nucleotide sugar dehydrogenase [Alphaproteobacteria bacterium]
MNDDLRIVVVGLGYVGLPLAVVLAKHFPVLGFDISGNRIAELSRGHDRTGEVDAEQLRHSTLNYTSAPDSLAGYGLYIVTVPTPVDDHNLPDLSPLRAACAAVGPALRRGATVVFESTVYPGVTEEICGPALEAASGLRCGQDFFLGYSPERINPGDREHTVDRITKVIAGQTPAVTELLARVYGKVTTGGVFRARDIKTAEAAKVIENAQRDVNIAFINEVAVIAQRLGLSVHDVLEAAGTKWNFMKFTPGFVGGHCIGVDPYYLAYRAKEVGHNPEIILAGRRLNDSMGRFVAERVNAAMGKPGRVLVLGLTFKEDVPDLRNTKIVDLVAELRRLGHQVEVHDAVADPREAADFYGITLIGPLSRLAGFDALIGAVPHAEYRALGEADLARLVPEGGVIADAKGLWRKTPQPPGRKLWQL